MRLCHKYQQVGVGPVFAVAGAVACRHSRGALALAGAMVCVVAAPTPPVDAGGLSAPPGKKKPVSAHVQKPANDQPATENNKRRKRNRPVRNQLRRGPGWVRSRKLFLPARKRSKTSRWGGIRALKLGEVSAITFYVPAHQDGEPGWMVQRLYTVDSDGPTQSNPEELAAAQLDFKTSVGLLDEAYIEPVELADVYTGAMVKLETGPPLTGVSAVHEATAGALMGYDRWTRYSPPTPSSSSSTTAKKSKTTVAGRRAHGLTGVVSLSRFNRGTADEVYETIRGLNDPETSNITGLVLDLRGNPGGYVMRPRRSSGCLPKSPESCSVRWAVAAR